MRMRKVEQKAERKRKKKRRQKVSRAGDIK